MHSSCRDIFDLKGANTRECTYRDLWHMILVPRAITHRMAIKSHMEQEVESPGGKGCGQARWGIEAKATAGFGGGASAWCEGGPKC